MLYVGIVYAICFAIFLSLAFSAPTIEDRRPRLRMPRKGRSHRPDRLRGQHA